MRARDNPFSTDRILRFRYRPLDEDWESLLGRLEHLHYRAAIVGPHGTGKTTLLEDLVPHLLRRGLRPILLGLEGAFAEDPTLSSHDLSRHWSRKDVLLLDGADRLSSWRWFSLNRHTRNAGGLVITSHRPGRLPTLVETRPSLQVLQEMVQALLEPEECGRLAADLPQLLDASGGNLREAIRRLYDRCAKL